MSKVATLFKDHRTQAATEATSPKSVVFEGSDEETFFIKAVGSAGTYAIDVWLFEGWEEIDTGALADGVVTVVTLAFTIPKARLRVTTVADAVVKAEVHAEGTEYEG